jgi:hypothetical protein
MLESQVAAIKIVASVFVLRLRNRRRRRLIKFFYTEIAKKLENLINRSTKDVSESSQAKENYLHT